MGYRRLGENAMSGYGPRSGLEGPFLFTGGRILYYDVKEGQYWDPRTDFYLSHEEMDQVHSNLVEVLSR